ncbi:hypothetical protein HYT24_03085 [Candidatus Pacearchaeota archaeon]|nr:hypothetical protein [Candidatus Pacearchaeota archaeon]
MTRLDYLRSTVCLRPFSGYDQASRIKGAYEQHLRTPEDPVVVEEARSELAILGLDINSPRNIITKQLNRLEEGGRKVFIR